MAETKEQVRSSGTDGSSRAFELVGDSPELVAFGLLRSVVQIEQKQRSVQIDRAWLLDAYAECLSAVQGNRVPGATRAESRAGKKAKGR